jgi:cullin 1
MAILLMFNQSDTVSYEDLLAATNLQKETLDPSIGIMLKAKVLTLSPDDKQLGPGTELKLNHGFKHKKLKVNLNVTIKSEQKQEAEETHKTIEEDRKMLMQVSYFPSSTHTDEMTLMCFLVCHRPHHEVSQADEAQPARRRDYPADQVPLQPQGCRHQEVYRHPAREGVSGTVGW